MEPPQGPRRSDPAPLWVRNASEVVLPEASGTGVERLAGYALVAAAGRVLWLGPERDTPQEFASAEVLDAAGGAVLPALVDAHTHLIHAGDRVLDFVRRSHGLTYAEIAAQGGGIHTTVQATRSASSAALLESTRERLLRREAAGIGTSELKSGYGLSVEHELRMLEVAADLRAEGFDVEATLLAAHTIPKDTPREAYVQAITAEMIPEVARRGLARFVDVFVERGAFTVGEARTIFAAGTSAGLVPRIHADQLTASGGAELAASVSAASADHLEHVTDAGVAALAQAGVVATLLPGAAIYLGDDARRLGRRLIDAGVEVAVATDQNPGSSPTSNLALMATLATTQMGLTAEEALRAITLGAAHALRRPDVGTLVPGALARFVVLSHADGRALVASYGEQIIRTVVLSVL